MFPYPVATRVPFKDFNFSGGIERLSSGVRREDFRLVFLVHKTVRA